MQCCWQNKMQIVPPWINHVTIVPSAKKPKNTTTTKKPNHKTPLAGLAFQFYRELPRQREQERWAQLQAPLASAAASFVIWSLYSSISCNNFVLSLCDRQLLPQTLWQRPGTRKYLAELLKSQICCLEQNCNVGWPQIRLYPSFHPFFPQLWLLHSYE